MSNNLRAFHVIIGSMFVLFGINWAGVYFLAIAVAPWKEER